MVLLKGFGQDGFRFFTNYESRKGKELVRAAAGAALGVPAGGVGGQRLSSPWEALGEAEQPWCSAAGAAWRGVSPGVRPGAMLC